MKGYRTSTNRALGNPFCTLLIAPVSPPLDLQQSMPHIETVFGSRYPGKLSSKFGSTDTRVQIKYRKGNQQITEKSQPKVILSVLASQEFPGILRRESRRDLPTVKPWRCEPILQGTEITKET